MQNLGNILVLLRNTLFGTKRRKLYSLLALYCIVVYLPYLLKGSLIYDDWAVAKLSRDCEGLFHSVSCFWPGYPDRPLAALYYSLCSNLFGSWAHGYILFTVMAWLGGITLLFRIFAEKITIRFATIFFVVAAVPSVSSTIIFSPAMQGIGAIAFLMWACSFFMLNKYIDNPNKKRFIFIYVFLLASLALYESSLPLFALTALWPLYLQKPSKDKKAYFIQYAKTFIVPLAAVLVILVCYQHFYVQQYYDYISKVRFSSMNGHVFDFTLRVLFNTAYVFVVSSSVLVTAAWMRLRHMGLGYVLGALVGVWFVVKSLRLSDVVTGSKKVRRYTNSKVLLLTIVGILLGVSVLHFVAVSPPTSVGYNNRGVVGISIALSLALAFLGDTYVRRKRYITVLFVACIAGYILSFVIQRNNYLLGAKMQKDIRAQAVSQVNKVNQDAMVVLADVPTYTDKNLNNETIFSDEVLDWGNFLRVYSDVKSIRGISLSPGRVKRGEVKVVEGKLHVMTYPEDVALDMVWYFDVKHMSLRKIEGADDLNDLLENTETYPPYNYLTPVDARVRNDIRNWISSY